MILYHYTGTPFSFNPTRSYSPEACEPYFKPVGLWLSDCSTGLGWKEVCERSEWNLAGVQHRTSFICDISKWKVLRTTDDIVSFTEEFLVGPHAPFKSIDWSRVMREYPGILITPYNWECRHQFTWYYGWDCASACVWDLSTIKLLKENPKEIL